MKPELPSHLDAEKRQGYLEFIKHVSPESDPTSVMLFGQVLRANNQLIQAAEKNLGTAGISWAKFRLLMDLSRGERHGAQHGMQPSQLSEMQGISRNTVSALIASLEKECLISRELHGTDRRRFVIRLTPEGRRVLRSKLDSQFKFVTRCFGSLSVDERHELLELLTRLNCHLKDQGK